MKVWLCSDGSYSDWHPTAVYSDEATAKRMTAAYGWENDPEEYELDPEVPAEAREGMFFYCVRMWENGDTERVYVTSQSAFATDQWEDLTASYINPRGGRRLRAYCWASDETHAVKIVNERRIMALASPERRGGERG